MRAASWLMFKYIFIFRFIHSLKAYKMTESRWCRECFFLLFFSMHVGGKLSGEKYGKTSTSGAVKKEQKMTDFFLSIPTTIVVVVLTFACIWNETTWDKHTKKADERKIKNLNFLLVLLVSDFFNLDFNSTRCLPNWQTKWQCLVMNKQHQKLEDPLHVIDWLFSASNKQQFN